MTRLGLLWVAACLLAAVPGCFDPTADGPPNGYENNDITCADGRDNDRDSFIDCEDIDCVSRALCGEQVIEGLRPTDRESNVRLCHDGIDNDNDGRFDCGDSDCQGLKEACCSNEVTDATCSDGVDNDGNGFTDCEDNNCTNGYPQVCGSVSFKCFDSMKVPRNCGDPDCAPACPESNCNDGLDDDDDGMIDCADEGCLKIVSCQTPEDTLEKCKDGVDNDGNTYLDCNDRSCSQSSNSEIVAYCASIAENTVEKCKDGIDNDSNSYTDCDDRACSQSTNQAILDYCMANAGEVSEADCKDGKDNDNNGYVDCADFSCSKSTVPAILAYCETRAENSYAKCLDGIDNDGNGYLDCDDNACEKVAPALIKFRLPDGTEVTKLASPCGEISVGPADCTDGIDNDGDGFTDCDDWDCSWNPLVNPGTKDATWSGPIDPSKQPCIDLETARPLVCG